MSTTVLGFASLSELPDASGAKLDEGGCAVISTGTVDGDDVVDVDRFGAVVAVATVEGTMVVSEGTIDVSGTVVSTGVCVSGGGGGSAGTTEEVVDEPVVVTGSTVVDGSGGDASVVVVVAGVVSPHQDKESNNHRSPSAGITNPTIGFSDSTRTVTSQHEPSIGWVNVDPSANKTVRSTVPFLAPAKNSNP